MTAAIIIVCCMAVCLVIGWAWRRGATGPLGSTMLIAITLLCTIALALVARMPIMPLLDPDGGRVPEETSEIEPPLTADELYARVHDLQFEIMTVEHAMNDAAFVSKWAALAASEGTADSSRVHLDVRATSLTELRREFIDRLVESPNDELDGLRISATSAIDVLIVRLQPVINRLVAPADDSAASENAIAMAENIETGAADAQRSLAMLWAKLDLLLTAAEIQRLVIDR